MVEYDSYQGIDMWRIDRLHVALIEGGYMEVRLNTETSLERKAKPREIRDLVKAVFGAKAIEVRP